MAEQKQSMVRTLTGVVVSNKMKDAIVVKVERSVPHPKYQKIVRKSTKMHVQDKGNTAGMGDVVVIRECRPISKTISWTLAEIKEWAA